jgi:hypothetical protein
MHRMRTWGWTAGAGLLAGAASGLVLLGAAGRMAMSGLALLAGQPLRWSLGGTLEVVAFGGLLGAPLGALYALLRRRAGRPSLVLGAAYGLLALAACVAVPPPAARSAFTGSGSPWLPVLALFGLVFAGYGVLLERLLRGRAGVSS